MIGGLLSLVSSLLFAYGNATVRRGVLTGTVVQAVIISLPVALPFFAVALWLSGGFGEIVAFSNNSLILFAVVGVIHFVFARYCNYRAVQAMGSNLVGPVQQTSLVITLVLAVLWLGETITLLRIVGIGLVLTGPAMMMQRPQDPKEPLALSADATSAVGSFKPNYRQGYFFAFLSALVYGISPIMIRQALLTKTIAAGIAGGFVSYIAATGAVALIVLLPEQWQRSHRTIDAASAKWFAISGIAVCFSQMFRYMALAVAPVSVVAPIQRLSLVFRVYFSLIMNREHEHFGGRVILGTAISFVGACALSTSADSIASVSQLFGWLESVAKPIAWLLSFFGYH